MRRRRQGRARLSGGERASLFFELFDLVTGVVRVLWRLPMLLLRLFD